MHIESDATGEVTLVGELSFVDLEGGFWQLTFGDESAQWGGRVVLGLPHQLHDQPMIDSGEQVLRARVRGRAREEMMSIFMAGTMFDVANLELL